MASKEDDEMQWNSTKMQDLCQNPQKKKNQNPKNKKGKVPGKLGGNK